MGIIIGGIIGLLLGKYTGMIIGAYVGYWLQSQFKGSGQTGTQRQIQESFFNALFLSMGKLAKADGRVSPVEIERTEGIMRHMKLTADMRARAIELFNRGKQGRHDIDQALNLFGRLAKRSLSLRQIFLEMLVDVAEADGMISRAEQNLIEKICAQIGYPHELFQAMMRMRGFASSGGFNQQQQSSSNRQQRRPTNQQAPFNPYHVLGVRQNDSKATIRKAYKRQISQHHPDKLVSKGLPPEMMKVAEEKAKQVQLAWEKIKDLKGW